MSKTFLLVALTTVSVLAFSPAQAQRNWSGDDHGGGSYSDRGGSYYPEGGGYRRGGNIIIQIPGTGHRGGYDDDYYRPPRHHGGDDDYYRPPRRPSYGPSYGDRDSDHDGIPDRYDRTPYGERPPRHGDDSYSPGHRPPKTGGGTDGGWQGQDTPRRPPPTQQQSGGTPPVTGECPQWMRNAGDCPDQKKSSGGDRPPQKQGDGGWDGDDKKGGGGSPYGEGTMANPRK